MHSVDSPWKRENVSPFREFKALSFDCYGTLIDWESGICAALDTWSKRHDSDIESSALLEQFGKHETTLEREHPGMVYPLVLANTLRAIGEETGIPVSDEDAAEFGASVGLWPAFPDSRAALTRLGERFRLIVLSNVDRGSFALSNLRLGVEFDLVLTAQDIGSYKPDLENFEAMLRALPELGIERTRLLHVAQSLYHDHVPAQQLGLPSVWIDRRGDRSGHGATPSVEGGARGIRWVYPSLSAFADDVLR